MSAITSLSAINHVLAVGSVDGICTAAAVLRLIGNGDVDVVFAQAFTVDKIDVATWQPDRKVAFVDLAVNNREPAMTERFVAAIREAGHTLVAIVDEHSREDWLKVLGTFDGLLVEPQSQTVGHEASKSSGEVLRRALAAANAVVDAHTAELLAAADAGDRMDFATHFGGMVNQAVKSAIADDTRRVYLARHLAANREADERILGWIAEYAAILANHDKVVESRVDLGNGIHRVSAVGLTVDMTTLIGRLYKEGARVVALEGEAFNKALGKKTRQIAFGTSEKAIDLLAIVKAAVSTASGFTQKVNVDPECEEVAIAAIRAALASK